MLNSVRNVLSIRIILNQHVCIHGNVLDLHGKDYILILPDHFLAIHNYLIVIDSYSKWPEIIPMESTTSLSTIKVLKRIFATHGLPERIVDNGPQFRSQEFKNFFGFKWYFSYFFCSISSIYQW